MKHIVVSGEYISDSDKKINEGVYRKDGKIYSLYTGVLYDNEFGIKVVPLNGKYASKIGDVIIGRVVSEENFFFVLDVNCPKTITLSKREVDLTLNPEDYLLLRVTSVNEVKEIAVEIISKLYNGNACSINSKKVPRVIGKSKSMLSLIEKYSESKVVVGANGYVYILGGNVELVKKALDKIEKYSHVDNLTSSMEEYLEKITN